MPTALYKDLRWRVVWRHCFLGEKAETIARQFYISTKTVYRLSHLFNQTCDIGLVIQRHGPLHILNDNDKLTLLNYVLAHPGVYLDEIQHHMINNTGVVVSKSTLCRELKRMGLTSAKK